MHEPPSEKAGDIGRTFRVPVAPSEDGRGRIVVCGGESLVRWHVTDQLRAEGFTVIVTPRWEECVEAVLDKEPEAIVYELGREDLDWQPVWAMRAQGVSAPVVLLASFGALDAAAARRVGASGVVSLPCDPRQVVQELFRAIGAERLAAEVRCLRERDRARSTGLLGPTELATVAQAAACLARGGPACVWIQGEPGSEMMEAALALHDLGGNRRGPFVTVDCASTPQEDIAAAIFGQDGLPGGAQIGALEVARGGTLALEEVGALPVAVQDQLARMLRDERYVRLRGQVPLAREADIIATSHASFAEKGSVNGAVVADLASRLQRCIVRLPPLRERKQEIPALVDKVLARSRRRLEHRLEGASPAALAALCRYDWPGNAHELAGMIDRIALAHRDVQLIELAHLPLEFR